MDRAELVVDQRVRAAPACVRLRWCRRRARTRWCWCRARRRTRRCRSRRSRARTRCELGRACALQQCVCFAWSPLQARRVLHGTTATRTPRPTFGEPAVGPGAVRHGRPAFHCCEGGTFSEGPHAFRASCVSDAIESSTCVYRTRDGVCCGGAGGGQGSAATPPGRRRHGRPAAANHRASRRERRHAAGAAPGSAPRAATGGSNHHSSSASAAGLEGVSTARV